MAGLWQFPNFVGRCDTQQTSDKVEGLGLKPKEILLQVEKKHIFTHIDWVLSGVHMEVAEKNDAFTWLTLEQIEQEAALPTAFRQFLDGIDTIK